jgi:hypothetical protein
LNSTDAGDRGLGIGINAHNLNKNSSDNTISGSRGACIVDERFGNQNCSRLLNPEMFNRTFSE